MRKKVLASPPRAHGRFALPRKQRWPLAVGLCCLLAHVGDLVVRRAQAQGTEAAGAMVSGKGGSGWWIAPEPPATGPRLAAIATQRDAAWPRFARAVQREGVVWSDTSRRKYPIGAVRLGGLVRVRPEKGGVRCKGGWYAVEPRGYACAAEGWRIGARPPKAGQVLKAPHARAVLPYDYVKVDEPQEYRFTKRPTLAQWRAARAGKEHVLKALGARLLEGTYFLAVERAASRGWLQTLEGNYVWAKSTKKPPVSQLRGERLSARHSLPMAFVVEDGAPVLTPLKGDLRVTARAERYARVPLRPSKAKHSRYVRTTDGKLLRRADVRVADQVALPGGVPDGERWIHINLESQTLVAYDGKAPTFVTLVSSGLPERNTPNGLYRARYKHRSVTMRGKDEAGPYEVQEVPWVFFFEGAYAVHGAYWHDTFGNPRSHGCVNVAPADARWLFEEFTGPDVPAGWHSAFDAGTYVYITGSGKEPPPLDQAS